MVAQGYREEEEEATPLAVVAVTDGARNIRCELKQV